MINRRAVAIVQVFFPLRLFVLVVAMAEQMEANVEKMLQAIFEKRIRCLPE
jgi:hypothetical protein